MRFLFVMDPVAAIDIDADSTFVMMLESQSRGHRVDWALMASLALDGSVPKAKAQRLELRRVRGDHFSEGPLEAVRLDDYDAIFMRKDPPFDVDFHLATLVLDQTDRMKTVLVNEPAGLRDFNEKLAAFMWAEFMPPSMATADRERIRAFLAEHGECIVKPLLNAGGEGIIRLGRDDKNTGSVLDLLTGFGRRMIEVQKFVPEVSQGDKRIILVDGEAIGAINRVPAADDNRANMHVGGRAEKVGLSERDRAIVQALGPELRRRGLVLVGLDVIGGFLTEVNVTSPTGLQELARFDGVKGEKQLIDWVEARRATLSHKT
ncbi:MAG: glutathione synthase [Myxococcota bacterium]